MSISRIQIEKIRPSMATPRKNTSRNIQVKTKGKNTPRAETFKNPLLGIEVNLMQKLQEVDEQYHDTSYKKRNVLLDAIEDIANTKTGFRKQLLDVLKVWRPPDTDKNLFKTPALMDLMRTQKQLRNVASDHEKADNKIRHLKQEIQMTELEIDEYQQKISLLREKLKNKSDHFSLARHLNNSLVNLQDSFNNIFVMPKSKPSNDEFSNLLSENRQLRKDRERMLYELNICKQITKRMEVAEAASSDDEI